MTVKDEMECSEPEHLEHLAMHGQPMPEDVGFSDKLLYLSLRSLYDLYRRSGVSRDEAKDIKTKLYEEYRRNSFDERLLDHHARIRNSYSHILTEAEKSGCQICKKLVRVFDGRDLE